MSLLLQPTGLRFEGFVSQFPTAHTVAATWDRDLMEERGKGIGREFRGRGVSRLFRSTSSSFPETFHFDTLQVHTHLGPVTGGPLGRSPLGGRNWEGFSPDPFLSSVASYITVKAIQDQGVITSLKHFIGYEQETFRTAVSIISLSASRPRFVSFTSLWPFNSADLSPELFPFLLSSRGGESTELFRLFDRSHRTSTVRETNSRSTRSFELRELTGLHRKQTRPSTRPTFPVLPKPFELDRDRSCALTTPSTVSGFPLFFVVVAVDLD